MARIELHGVTASYDGKTPVVRDVSLEVADGEVMTVLGPSGCGKSTLLRVLAGLEKPDAGEVVIDGRVVNGVEPKDRDVAMVFQSYALYPHMRVHDNIAVGLRLRGVPPAQVRDLAEAAARRLGIERLLRRYPRELSGGERQRVALARALVRRPKVFLLDEPLSNLDAQLRERARAELKEIFQDARATVIYVTHDQIEALTLSDRVAVMRVGRLEQIGTPDEIYEKPGSVFVASFVGSPAMNLLEGVRLGDNAAIVGFRPEDVELYAANDAPPGAHAMQVASRDSLGSQHLLFLRGGEALEIRALVPATFPVVEAVRVRLPLEKAHRFGAEGGRLD